jgi:hypothetical protein
MLQQCASSWTFPPLPRLHPLCKGGWSRRGFRQSAPTSPHTLITRANHAHLTHSNTPFAHLKSECSSLLSLLFSSLTARTCQPSFLTNNTAPTDKFDSRICPSLCTRKWMVLFCLDFASVFCSAYPPNTQHPAPNTQHPTPNPTPNTQLCLLSWLSLWSELPVPTPRPRPRSRFVRLQM